MKVADVRLKKGIRNKIKETQKIYNYICPLKNIQKGDMVLVDVQIHHTDGFEVGRVEDIYDMSFAEIAKKKIYGFVIMKMPLNFEKHCDRLKKQKYKLFSKYSGTYKIKKEKISNKELD